MHFSITVYHLSSTCRIGSVVDPQLRVAGVVNLRVADASIMPDVVSGNTNAACIMIGEKAAEMVAADHGVQLKEFAVSLYKESAHPRVDVFGGAKRRLRVAIRKLAARGSISPNIGTLSGRLISRRFRMDICDANRTVAMNRANSVMACRCDRRRSP